MIDLKFVTVKSYLPEICPEAYKTGNHFECRGTCPRQEAKYICPCYGRNGFGWIPADGDEMIQKVKDFNARRERLYPMITEYEFDGLNQFRAHGKRFLIKHVDSSNRDEVKEELIALLDNGDDVGYNYDHGVGHFIKEEDGTYTVESWCYNNKSISVDHGTPDDVLDYIEEMQY